MPKKITTAAAPASDEMLERIFLACLAADAEDPKRALALARRALAVWENRENV